MKFLGSEKDIPPIIKFAHALVGTNMSFYFSDLDSDFWLEPFGLGGDVPVSLLSVLDRAHTKISMEPAYVANPLPKEYIMSLADSINVLINYCLDSRRYSDLAFLSVFTPVSDNFQAAEMHLVSHLVEYVGSTYIDVTHIYAPAISFATPLNTVPSGPGGIDGVNHQSGLPDNMKAYLIDFSEVK